MKQKRKYTNSGMKAEEFIRLWQESPDLTTVLKKTGLPPGSASGRARLYRSRGIPLKRFGRGTEAMDISALAKLAKSIKPRGPEGRA